MREFVMGLVLVAVALAGCSGGGGKTSSEDGAPVAGPAGAHGQHNAATHILAPNLTVGDSWTFASPVYGSYAQVIAGESGDFWTLDTDNPDIAFFDARYDSSFLGAVRKSDLAGSQGSDVIEYFRFPLTQGKNWTTPWDGEEKSVRVTQVANGRAALEARHANDTLYATYTFDSKIGYFRDYTFYEEDGETVRFEGKLTASGKAFAGDLVRWALQPMYETHGRFPGTLSAGTTVPAGVTDVYIELMLACVQGGFSITAAPTQGVATERGITLTGPCPANLAEQDTFPAIGQNEDWRITVTPIPQATQATLDFVVMMRTQTLFKVGAAP